jgi:exonuclease VII small subunit
MRVVILWRSIVSRCGRVRGVADVLLLKTFLASAPFFGRSRLFATATRVVEKLEKVELERNEAKRERDEAEVELDEAKRELKKAKGKLDDLTEKRERGESVDDAAFTRVDKAVERAVDFFKRADDAFKLAGQLLLQANDRVREREFFVCLRCSLFDQNQAAVFFSHAVSMLKSPHSRFTLAEVNFLFVFCLRAHARTPTYNTRLSSCSLPML